MTSDLKLIFSHKGVFVHTEVLFSLLKWQIKEGADVRRITRTEIFNHYAEVNAQQICTEYQLISKV